jgi:WD40 repeat protein
MILASCVGSLCVLQATVPMNYDQGASVVVAGFADGVVRVLARVDDPHPSMALMAVVKPHTQAVTAIAFSPDASLVATAGADQTVFYFSYAGGVLAPIGFITLPHAITTMAFSHDSSLLLLGCGTDVHFVSRPNVDALDTSITWKIELKTKVFHFPAPPKPVVIVADEEKKDKKDDDLIVPEEAAPLQPPNVVTVLPMADGMGAFLFLF